MGVAKRDIEIIKGDDYLHVVTLETTTGPIDITGRTYTAMIRKNKTQTVPDATFLVSVTDGPNGKIAISLANTITTTLKSGCYYWDLQQNASGIINTILGGKVEVITDVTR